MSGLILFKRYESIKCTSRNVQLQHLAPRVACLAAAPNSSRRFGPASEVKERLHRSAFRRTGSPSADVASGRGVVSRRSFCAFLILYILVYLSCFFPAANGIDHNDYTSSN
jgi:hypothetical protein